MSGVPGLDASMIPRDENGKFSGSNPTWTREPVRRTRKAIKAANDGLTDEQRSHITLWLDDLTESMGADPRQQAMLAMVASAYTECVKLQARLLETKIGTKENEQAASQSWLAGVDLRPSIQ